MSGIIEFEVLYNHKEYTPGETLNGKIRWAAGAGPVEQVVARLFWYTSGRGTRDTGVIEEMVWNVGGSTQGEEAFSFVLPMEPFSFSGSLITLTWGLEAILKPGDTSEVFDFFLSPTGKEIVLTPVEDETKSDRWHRVKERMENRT